MRRKMPVLNYQKYDAKKFRDAEEILSIVEFQVCQIPAHHDNISYFEAKVWQKKQSDRNFYEPRKLFWIINMIKNTQRDF